MRGRMGRGELRINWLRSVGDHGLCRRILLPQENFLIFAKDYVCKLIMFAKHDTNAEWGEWEADVVR